MSHIQLPYGYVNKQKQIRFDLPNNYEESFYLNKVPYLTNQNPAVGNKLINLIKNRDDLKKWLLATSDYGREIEQILSAVVGPDEKFNNSIVRHALDLKDEAIFRNPNAFNVTFYDMKKFDQVNPIIGKLAAQVRASKLTEKELNQKLLDNFEADQIQARLDRLKYGDSNNNDGDGRDDDDNKGPGGTPGGTRIIEPLLVDDDYDELLRRLDRLRGNTTTQTQHISPGDTEYLNFYNRRIRQRQKETTGLKKGARGKVGRKRSSIENSLKFRLPDTPPLTPEDRYWEGVADEWIPHSTSLTGPAKPPLFDYDRDFQPRQFEKGDRNLLTPLRPLPPTGSTVEKSISPLRNKLPSIDPFPSLPNINDFSRPITDVVDEKNKTIEITPKKIPLLPIGQKQLSEELHKIFPDVDATIKERESSFKERTENIEELVEKIGKSEESELTFEFEFFNGGENLKFDSFLQRFGLNTENYEFIKFLQSEYCKEIMQSNNLKIHIETGNIYYDDKDTNESIFDFIQNQQNPSKGIIKHDFEYSGNLINYYKWIINEFDAIDKTNYDILTFRNVKFLLYR